MAYVIVEPAKNMQLSLEGRPLQHGDPLWVPVDAEPSDVVREWLAAVFVEADARRETITVTIENQARLSLPMKVGVRRREQPGA
jgi:hypothetical protein